MYEIVNVQYTGTYNNGGNSIPAVLGEFRASSAADLPAQNVDCHIICGCDGLDIATGDRYIWNGTAWILQPSDRAFSNVYTKPEIDSMTTEIYDVIAYYHTTLISDTGEITFYSLGGNVGTWAIYGNGQQTGIPTPANPIQPDFVGKKVGADWTIPISCAGQTTPVYLGQVSTVRKIRKLVLTGEETITFYSAGATGIGFYISLSTMMINSRKNGYCTHFKPQMTPSGSAIDGVTFGANSNQIYFTFSAEAIDDYNLTDLASIKTWLASQYAAGTPVTIWYVLAEPQTAIVNEPLCKIGDYADELHSEDADVCIPTVNGANLLTVDTDLKPSKIEISGER